MTRASKPMRTGLESPSPEEGAAGWRLGFSWLQAQKSTYSGLISKEDFIGCGKSQSIEGV